MIEVLTQLGLGFIIALSGALIPGPLLVFVITHTLRTGKRTTGLVAALGHCFVEVFIILGIIIGLGALFESVGFQRIIDVIGGFALIVFGIMNLVELRRGELGLKDGVAEYGSLAGGIVFTVFNPTVPLWWTTVGLTMMNKALKTTTMLGVALWVLGHWLADLAWFGFTGYSVFRGKNYIGKRTHRYVTLICGAFLIVLGTLFLRAFFAH